MAEEFAGTTLIKNTPREELVLKLNSFKVSNMTAKERDEYERLALHFAQSFRKCAYSFLGVSQSQLDGLKDDELIDCAKLLYDRVWQRALFYKFIFGVIPNVGLVCVMAGAYLGSVASPQLFVSSVVSVLVGLLCLGMGTYDFGMVDCSLYFSNRYKRIKAKPFPIEIMRKELL